MKRKISLILMSILLAISVIGCNAIDVCDLMMPEPEFDDTPEEYNGVHIQLSDEGIIVDGSAISTDKDAAVYAAKDIIYYESGHDFTYGEGTEEDAHTKEEADAHTVVHITKAGQYVLSGELSKGQIAVDLGEDAEENPEAVVTLVLDGVDVTCEVAPAVIFYNVYECGDKDESAATKDVDLSDAGARVIIANNTQNTVNGSYVAKIYKPGTLVLNDAGTEVTDAKKLHKYDGAFYSKMSMRIQGGQQGNGNGKLQINAANEGLDSELHLTIDGGDISIVSGNDGINTNEDNVSVTTINNGRLSIVVDGATGEGDGIDSNGWLVINGGTVLTQACAFSGDAGIDSDKGIHINGGIVVASGNMLDRIEGGGQTHAVFTFRQSREDSNLYMKNADGDIIVSHDISNAYTYVVVSTPCLTEGEYTLWDGDKQLAGTAQGGGMGIGGGGQPSRPDGQEMPEGQQSPDGERPEPPEKPEGMIPPSRPKNENAFEENKETSQTFTIKEGANYFQIA